MPSNPLFPTGDNQPNSTPYGDASQQTPVPIPPGVGNTPAGANPAADLVRQKLARLYAEEPDAKTEAQEAETIKPRSKHQQFMYELSTSGKSLADIQTEWHTYYTNLPDNEKHEVWQEFYDTTAQLSSSYRPKSPEPVPAPEPEKPKRGPKRARKLPPKPKPKQPETPKKASPQNGPDGTVVSEFTPRELPTNRRTRAIDRRTATEIRRAIKNKVSAGGKLKVKHHVQSLLFGLGMGLLVIFIFLFGFFNQFIITPFMQPGRNASTTPIILSSSGVAPTTDPEVIIPKINVELPVDYNQTSTDETQIENALEGGVVHYPTTVMPGEKGNTAYFGHSSNNVFAPGKYKYAFVLLRELVPGDTFYLTKDSKIYVYKVINRKIVPPTEVSVLGPVPGQIATATLITCDPPGTSLNRLVVVGQQISPEPSKDAAPVTTAVATTSPTALPGNGPSLWGRITSTLIGKLLLAAAFLAGLAVLVWSARLVRKNL